MGQIVKKYQFRGLDTRTNKLYRQEGTASDCRNVYKNSNGDLIKRPDFSALNVPRGTAGETGLFLDKIPFEAEIIDFAKYEDHILLITRIPLGAPLVLTYANKYYRFFEDSETVEFIPFACETYDHPTYGQIPFKTNIDTKGKYSKINQEGILYVMGQYNDLNYTDIFEDSRAAENNLAHLIKYDGKEIQLAGTKRTFRETFEAENEGTLTGNEYYTRLLPFTIDDKGRATFGNYSTHRANFDTNKAVMALPVTEFDSLQDVSYNCGVRLTETKFMSSDSNVADRTYTCVFYNRTTEYYGVAAGQFLIYCKSAFDPVIGAPPPEGGTIDNPSISGYSIYRLEVESVDYNANTITFKNIQLYDANKGEFVNFAGFQDGTTLYSNRFASHQVYAVYQSQEREFGFQLQGLVSHCYTAGTNSELRFEWWLSNTGGIGYIEYAFDGVPFLAERFEDGYDENTVKEPPPKGKRVIDYLGALVIVDHELLYFSDISTGGSIEAFTPFDNFVVGSSKRGSINGVFANETFIAVFREEEAYYITGNIFLANYRVQSYQSTRIGCADPRSIIDFRGAGMFLSQRGFYVCQQGGSMPEISDNIETVFTDGDLDLDLLLTNTSAVVDFKREYIYFYVDSNDGKEGYIFAFSYYHKDWFLWDEVRATDGFEEINQSLYYCDGDNLYKEGDTNVNSDAYYQSNFETLGEPSFEKKFLQILLFIIDMPTSARFTIKTYRDWITSKFDTKESKTAKKDEVDYTQRFNPTRSKSLAMRIESASGQALRLNGYEYEVEADVRMFKDDD